MVLFGLSAAEGDCAGDRSGPGAYRVSVIAALDDPLAVFVAYDLAHVMRPYDDGPHGRSARVCSVTRPRASEIE
jgi:hypothetical protein